ncbi:hypothetical protein GLOIN_2v1869233 [Rhizophagus clarus]|uniref:Uncharacterized protein n=1 Tax=Rhizophagus clarus TaxID=94130 RepID=A0A8H3LSE9_9GLOM|nr:hypothetical protein GLOIN_2v1869233 [Rhizophagus clarus]
MKLKHLLIFFSIIIFTTLSVKSNFITYTERETTEFDIGGILSYEDNTIVLQIVRNLSGGNCSETNISLRVIYPNGTITPIDLSMEELGIQPLNFCTVDGFSPITLYALDTKEGNFILVTYTEAADVNNPFTYDDYVMLIDLNGKIYSKTSMGPSLVDPTNNNTWAPGQSTITPNVNDEQEFLYFTLLSSSYNDAVFIYCNLTQWIINEDGTLSNTTEAMVLPFQLLPSIISTVDGDYMFIYPNSLSSSNTSQDHFSSQAGLYAVYWEYRSNIARAPVILYEISTITEFNITELDCVVSYSEVGQICLVTMQPNSTNPNSTPVYIIINFVSGGSVFSAKHIDATLPKIIGIAEIDDPQFLILPLPFGGYFYSVNQQTNISDDNSPYDIWGFVLDDNGNFIQWNLSNPVQSDSNALPQVLTNNTLIIVQPIVGQYWSLITTDLYKFHEDNSYHNIFINTTNPTIGQNIIANETYFLTITYTVPVVLSNGTFTIFQNNGSSNPGIVRQIINGLNNNEYATINNDTVSVTIIESTFNNPGSTYYVTIENNFVLSLLYNGPLPGLSSNIWSFTTTSEEKEQESKIKQLFDGIYGKVKLTEDGTSYFDNLNHSQKNEFFNNLTQELANAVVVATERITTNYRFVIDTESSSKQYFLSVKIEKPQDASDKWTKLIAKDLNVMIQNMDITVLTSESSSKYLESIYGYVTIPIFFLTLTILCFISICYDAKNKVKSDAKSNVKNDVKNDSKYNIYNKKHDIKTFFYIMLCDVYDLIQFLQLLSCKKKMVNRKKMVDEDKKNHFKIYSYGFNFLSFVLDILFAKIEAGSVKSIFFASVFFVTIPYVVKLGYAVYIILDELVREENTEDSNQLSNELLRKEDSEDSDGQQDGSQDQQDNAEEKVPIKKWLKDSKSYKIILVILISLAGAEVEVLKMVNFQYCGYKFNVKLSEEFEERIILGEIIGIIIKNIPDFAIRVYFLSKAIDFSYLSTLTLLVTVIKILGLITKPIELNIVKRKRRNNYNEL